MLQLSLNPLDSYIHMGIYTNKDILAHTKHVTYYTH